MKHRTRSALGLLGCLPGVSQAAADTGAASAAVTGSADPLWTALGLGAAIVVAYGITRAVVRPLLGSGDDEDGVSAMSRVEIATLRACADDLAVGVAAADADGRVLFANRALCSQATAPILPGHRLAAACGGAGLEAAMRRVADTHQALDTELELSWGATRVRIVPAPAADAAASLGSVVFFRSRAVSPDAPAADPGERLRRGPIEIDPILRRALVDGGRMDLTDTEYRLLTYFVGHPGQVLTRAVLLRDVWGHKGPVYSRTVDTHVQRLRDKLGAQRDCLETVRGAGYRMRDA